MSLKDEVDAFSVVVFDKIMEQAMGAVAIEIARDPDGDKVTDAEVEAARAGVAVGAAMAVQFYTAQGWIDEKSIAAAFLRQRGA